MFFYFSFLIFSLLSDFLRPPFFSFFVSNCCVVDSAVDVSLVGIGGTSLTS